MSVYKIRKKKKKGGDAIKGLNICAQGPYFRSLIPRKTDISDKTDNGENPHKTGIKFYTLEESDCEKKSVQLGRARKVWPCDRGVSPSDLG